MKYLKYINGQITISTLTGICILIGAIGAPFVYIKNIEADSNKADADMKQVIAVNSNRILTLEENYKKIDNKLDALLMERGIKVKQ